MLLSICSSFPPLVFVLPIPHQPHPFLSKGDQGCPDEILPSLSWKWLWVTVELPAMGGCARQQGASGACGLRVGTKIAGSI